jgi:hypothetical protein
MNILDDTRKQLEAAFNEMPLAYQSKKGFEIRRDFHGDYWIKRDSPGYALGKHFFAFSKKWKVMERQIVGKETIRKNKTVILYKIKEIK